MYTDGPFFQRGAGARTRRITATVLLSGERRLPPPLCAAHLVQSTCSSELLLRSFLCPPHTVRLECRQPSGPAPLLKMLAPSHRSYPGHQGRVALFHLFCSIAGECAMLLGRVGCSWFIFSFVCVCRTFVHRFEVCANESGRSGHRLALGRFIHFKISSLESAAGVTHRLKQTCFQLHLNAGETAAGWPAPPRVMVRTPAFVMHGRLHVCPVTRLLLLKSFQFHRQPC